MPRPKKSGFRFRPGDRVAWTSPSAKLGLDKARKRTGTVVSVGRTREEAASAIPKEYGIHYKSTRAAKGPFYYVAADTPLFKPGYTVHSVPEKRLQHEESTLEYKLGALRGLEEATLRVLASTVAAATHRTKSPALRELAQNLRGLCPAAFRVD